MASSTIPALTAGSAPDGTELFYGVQGGADRKFTTAQLGAGAAIIRPGTSLVKTPPTTAQLAGAPWTALNAGASATLTDSIYGLRVDYTGQAGNWYFRSFYQAIPSTPFSCTMEMSTIFTQGNSNWQTGILLYESATGKVAHTGRQGNGAVFCAPWAMHNSSILGNGGDTALWPSSSNQIPHIPTTRFWIRVTDSGTTYTGAYSFDGVNFYSYPAVLYTDNLLFTTKADKIGFSFGIYNDVAKMQFMIHDFYFS